MGSGGWKLQELQEISSRVRIVDAGLRRKRRKVKKESRLRYSLSRATTHGKERSVL